MYFFVYLAKRGAAEGGLFCRTRNPIRSIRVSCRGVNPSVMRDATEMYNDIRLTGIRLRT